MVFKTGELVVSIAGHDEGSIYLVIGDDEDKVLLADGRKRKLAKPKRKNKKHVQLIHKHIEEISSKIEEGQAVDADIVYAIRILKGECNV